MKEQKEEKIKTIRAEIHYIETKNKIKRVNRTKAWVFAKTKNKSILWQD